MINVDISAPDIARNNMMRGGHSLQSTNSKNNTLNSAARRRMEDRLFTRNVSSIIQNQSINLNVFN